MLIPIRLPLNAVDVHDTEAAAKFYMEITLGDRLPISGYIAAARRRDKHLGIIDVSSRVLT